jgi:hypothetical protein
MERYGESWPAGDRFGAAGIVVRYVVYGFGVAR